MFYVEAPGRLQVGLEDGYRVEPVGRGLLFGHLVFGVVASKSEPGERLVVRGRVYTGVVPFRVQGTTEKSPAWRI